MDPPAPAVRWLVGANIAWLAAGALAYYTAARFSVLTAIAILVALPGLMRLRTELQDPQCRRWLDISFSCAVGTWAILAMMVVIPYVASEGGNSLWSSNAYATLGLAVSSLGALAWNATAFQGLAAWDDVRSARLYSIFHLVVLAGALFYSRDARVVEVMLRGEVFQMVDLAVAPALASVAGIVWAVALWRSRPAISE